VIIAAGGHSFGHYFVDASDSTSTDQLLQADICPTRSAAAVGTVAHTAGRPGPKSQELMLLLQSVAGVQHQLDCLQPINQPADDDMWQTLLLQQQEPYHFQEQSQLLEQVLLCFQQQQQQQQQQHQHKENPTGLKLSMCIGSRGVPKHACLLALLLARQARKQSSASMLPIQCITPRPITLGMVLATFNNSNLA
jgi:hypothetical protein